MENRYYSLTSLFYDAAKSSKRIRLGKETLRNLAQQEIVVVVGYGPGTRDCPTNENC